MDQALKLLRHWALHTAIQAPCASPLDHRIRRCAARTDLTAQPSRKILSVRSLHSTDSKVLHDLMSMAPAGSAVPIITVEIRHHGFDLLREIRRRLRWNLSCLSS